MLIVLFLLWLVFNGSVTVEIVVFGVIGALIVYLFMCLFLNYSPRMDLRLLLNLPWMVGYAVILVTEIIKASLNVMKVSLRPQLRPDPFIIEFHSGFDREICNVLLANSITLTPGTITVFQEGDYFVVHCLRREYAEGIENSIFVRFLRRMH